MARLVLGPLRGAATGTGAAGTRLLGLGLVLLGVLVAVVLLKSIIRGNLLLPKSSCLPRVSLYLSNNLLVLNVNHVDETALPAIWPLHWGFLDLVGEEVPLRL